MRAQLLYRRHAVRPRRGACEGTREEAPSSAVCSQVGLPERSRFAGLPGAPRRLLDKGEWGAKCSACRIVEGVGRLRRRVRFAAGLEAEGFAGLFCQGVFIKGKAIRKGVTMAEQAKMRGFHYAWLILISCCFMFAGSMALINSIIGVYMVPVTTALGCARGDFTFMLTTQAISIVISMPIWGNIFQNKKISINLALTVGALTMIACPLICSFASDLTVFYIAGFLGGIGIAACFTMATPVLIGNWFAKQHRGKMIGIASCFAGVSTIFWSPLFHRCHCPIRIPHRLSGQCRSHGGSHSAMDPVCHQARSGRQGSQAVRVQRRWARCFREHGRSGYAGKVGAEDPRLSGSCFLALP